MARALHARFVVRGRMCWKMLKDLFAHETILPLVFVPMHETEGSFKSAKLTENVVKASQTPVS